MSSKIPTYESGESARTSLREGGADASSFGHRGLEVVAEATNSAAHTLSLVARNVNISNEYKRQAEEKRKHRDDLSWVVKSVEQERAHLNEYFTNPDNNSKETFAKDFRGYALDRIKEYEAASPGPEASAAFRDSMLTFVAGRYDNALSVSEKNHIDGVISGIEDTTSNIISSYKNASKIPGVDATSELHISYSLIESQIDDSFGNQSPALVKRLKSELVTEVVLASAKNDPDFARQIVDQSESLDEKQRISLHNHIDQETKTRNIVEVDSFQRLRNDYLVQVKNGFQTEKLPLGNYEMIYPPDESIKQKRRDDELIDVFNKANKTVTALSGKSARKIVSEVSKIQDNIKSTEDEDVAQIVTTKLRDVLELQSKDRVSWMEQYVPEIKSLSEDLQNASDSDKARLITERNESVLKYQGFPPEDTPSDERDKYLALPTNDRHLMKLGEATGYANMINHSPAEKAVEAIGSVLTNYSDTKHQFIAFNDLVTMPNKGDGILQEYQLAWQNKDAGWVDTYVGALQNTKALGELTTEKRVDLENEILLNKTWTQFQRSMIGDQQARADEIVGYRNGIITYANAMIVSGKPLEDAVKISVNRLVGTTLGFPDVNGSPVAILREKSDPSLTPRSDKDIEDIGRRLSVSLKYLDPRDVNQGQFPVIQGISTEKSPERMQELRDIITSKGFFQTGNDGQSVSLYVEDDAGYVFQVLDRKNKPYVIHFDDLPNFQEDEFTEYDPFNPRKRNMVPSKRYKLPLSETNWPQRPDFVK